MDRSIRSSIYRVLSCAAIMILLISGLLVTAPIVPAFGVVTPPNFVDSDFISGLASPTAMDFAPDGRLFVTEKGGNLRVIKNGALLATPFLKVSVNTSGERGLLGIAFDPNFASNGYLYVYYTTSTSPIHNRISRFTASVANPDVAVVGSEMVLLDLETLGSTIHNAGAMHFGNDGKLYVSTGENAVSSNAQSLGTRLGKILRINSDGTIPPDNPFFYVAGAKKEIWALGLRNPFSFAFKPGTDIMYINDVGNNAWEEINQGFSGANYGWPTCEGPCSNPNFVDPIYAYQHPSGEGRAATGGAFYVENQFPVEYNGSYFFGDYAADFIKSLTTLSNGVNEVDDFLTEVQSPVDIKIGPDGSLYYLSIYDGKVGKVQYVSGGNSFPFAVANANPMSGIAPLSVSFDASGSGDLDGDALSYSWDFGEGSPLETDPQVEHVYASDGPYAAKLTVSDGNGGVDSVTLNISVGIPPIGQIELPVAGTHYDAGDTISFKGSATDNGSSLPASAFRWEVRFHHNTHSHPFEEFVGVKEGSFEIPQIGEASGDVWYRIYLTVTDSSGLTHLIVRDVLPNKVTLELATNTPGLMVKLDGQPQILPRFVVGVVGMERTLEAPLEQDFCGQSFEFESWSDGLPAIHDITTPAVDTTYAATYDVASGGQDPHHRTKSDFNGDGYSDLAIGVPEEDVGTKIDAGIVNVIYGSSSGLSATAAKADQVFSQNSPNVEGAAENGDRFGAAIAVGDFNGDGYSDLAIGVPDEDIGSKADGGSVNVIYGSSSGLSATAKADQTWSQDKAGIDDYSEPGDKFGSSLAVGDFNNDGYDDLAIGVPYEDVRTFKDAGGIEIIYGSSSGLSPTIVRSDHLINQNSSRVKDVVEAFDNFGWSLTSGNFNGDLYSDLAVGVIGENTMTGAVSVIYGSSSGVSAAAGIADQIWTQDRPGVEGMSEGNDRFGWSLAAGDFDCDGKDDLAIGTLEEGKAPSNAGAVNVIYGSSPSGLSTTAARPDQIWTQDSPDVENILEGDDKFGSSLAVGDFNNDGYDDLAIGVPSEDNTSFPNSGGVSVIYGSSSSGLSPTSGQVDQFWTQDSADMDEASDTNDFFGSALSAADFNNDGYDDLAIGVPYEDLGGIADTGAIAVIYGSTPGLASSPSASATSRSDQLWHQSSGNIEDTNEAGDNFGAATASG